MSSSFDRFRETASPTGPVSPDTSVPHPLDRHLWMVKFRDHDDSGRDDNCVVRPTRYHKQILAPQRFRVNQHQTCNTSPSRATIS